MARTIQHRENEDEVLCIAGAQQKRTPAVLRRTCCVLIDCVARNGLYQYERNVILVE